MKEINNISIYGSGQVAWHLGKWFKRAGLTVDYVYNRTPKKAQELASVIKATATTNLNKLMKSDVLIIAVSDDAIKQVSGSLPRGKAIVAHTSGNTSLDAVWGHEKRGVFYPLQTFSRELKIDINQVPFLLEAGDTESYEELRSVALKLSPKAYNVSSHQRRRLHIAAVFANNFTNHMCRIAWDICEENDIPFEVLLPLIKQTAEKIENSNPVYAQTGPAIRNDKKTIKAHLDLLEGKQAELYKLITESIEEQEIKR